MLISFEPCHRLAAEAVSDVVAALCASAGAAIKAEPITAAARNLVSIFFLLGDCGAIRAYAPSTRRRPRWFGCLPQNWPITFMEQVARLSSQPLRVSPRIPPRLGTVR